MHLKTKQDLQWKETEIVDICPFSTVRKRRLLSAVRSYHSTQSKQSFLVKSISEVPLKERYRVKMGEKKSEFADTNTSFASHRDLAQRPGRFSARSPDASSVETPTFAYGQTCQRGPNIED